ncbi:MAG: beta-hydroxyacyl-ACP dehydratase [Phycisphaerae bacterium]|nr:beta-hydroxyacyl-ACP dehydratase [Phycisphaerae bacterium]NUQ47597.1 beta-hydroxyacyl-ACP dehydratase [Phycisphaerae bacterium]
MPPPALLDLSKLDLNRVEMTREQIYEVLPHRHEFMQLDGVIHLDADKLEIVAYRDVKPDEWWCKGHLPGRPLFPGVLMIETAAHIASVYFSRVLKEPGFLGFGGVDSFKFREAVIPPARLYILGRAVEVRRRRMVCDVQGFVNEAMVFEGRITGLPM